MWLNLRESTHRMRCQQKYDYSFKSIIDFMNSSNEKLYGEYFWRVDGKGKPRPNYPAEIHRFWQMLPKNLTKVDAVYERPHDGNIRQVGDIIYVMETTN
ncbi:hypothetical protein Avbf_03219 [Armadillidium vulgare]|nr:hypothetical protein Avbf_03219 [Armadillidium vulgare]